MFDNITDSIGDFTSGIGDSISGFADSVGLSGFNPGIGFGVFNTADAILDGRSPAQPFLSTIGTAFGGPVGGAIGSLVGGALSQPQIDEIPPGFANLRTSNIGPTGARFERGLGSGFDLTPEIIQSLPNAQAFGRGLQGFNRGVQHAIQSLPTAERDIAQTILRGVGDNQRIHLVGNESLQGADVNSLVRERSDLQLDFLRNGFNEGQQGFDLFRRLDSDFLVGSGLSLLEDNRNDGIQDRAVNNLDGSSAGFNITEDGNFFFNQEGARVGGETFGGRSFDLTSQFLDPVRSQTPRLGFGRINPLTDGANGGAIDFSTFNTTGFVPGSTQNSPVQGLSGAQYDIARNIPALAAALGIS